MDNYELAQERARTYFLDYDIRKLINHPGVTVSGNDMIFLFIGATGRIDKDTGNIRFRFENGHSWDADFSEALSVYDWLCDGKLDAKMANDFCPVHALPGVLVSGSGLMMKSQQLSDLIDRDPQGFTDACIRIGGCRYPCGDIGFRIPIFSNMDVVLKFYHSDEEFPSQLTLLWDKNALDFVRYETLYYIAGVLFRRLINLLNHSVY